MRGSTRDVAASRGAGVLIPVSDAAASEPAPLHSEPLATSDSDLALASGELLALLLNTEGIEGFLTELSTLAAATLAASCGITVTLAGRTLTVAASDALAAAVDEVQYGEGQGPCLQALDTGEVVVVSDLQSEQRWGDYPAHAMTHQVRSSLSLPLTGHGKDGQPDLTVGALNLYSHAPGAFDHDAVVDRATALAAQGSAVLGVVLRQTDERMLNEQLQEALASRSTIDQAVGILMAQQRCSADSAFAILRRASQNHNRKIRDIASDITRSAAGGAPDAAAT